MKKFIVATILALAASVSFAAGQVAVEYDHAAYTAGPLKDANVNAVSVAPGLRLGNTTLDVRLQNVNGTYAKPVANYEVRAKQAYDLGNGFGAFVRAGLGYMTWNDESVKYYTIEPGVTYALTSALALNSSYVYTNDFESKVAGNAFLGRSNRVNVGADYSVTKEDVVGVKLYRQLGDNDASGITLGYTRLFQ